MPYVFLIAGIVFQVIGAGVALYFRKTAERRMEKFADEHLSEYQSGQTVPEAEAREFMKKGVARIVSVLAIPLSLNLIGTVLIVIYIIIHEVR